MSRPPRLPARRAGLLLVTLLSLAAVAVVARTRAAGPDRIGWTDDLSVARRTAAAQRKAVLIDLTADWCPACQELKRTTWSDVGVASAVAERCVPVRVDVDRQPELARRYNAEYLPTLVLTDADGRELRRTVGYLAPDELRAWLNGRS